MIRQLRLKFVCINMVIVTVMLMIIFGMVLHSTIDTMDTQSAQMLRLLNNGRTGPNQRFWNVRLPFFTADLDNQGAITGLSGGYLEVNQLPVESLVAQAKASSEDMGLLRQHQLRFLKRATPFGMRIAFVDVSSAMATLKGLVKICVCIGLLSFSVFLGLSFLLARWAIRPVEEAWNRQKQFIADASHELKTPLTVIMTNGELLQNPDYSPNEREQFTSSILAMSRQMRELVERLLELARVDNGTAKMAFSPLDLSGLAADALLPFEPVFFERGLRLESRIEPGIRVSGSASHLNQVLDILLDNAMKYSAPQGTVILRLHRAGSHCLLSLASPGDPISREDLKNIFKRFYRIDKARSGESYGLGLSIAQSILSEHGGKIWAESSGGNNSFFVQLPLL